METIEYVEDKENPSLTGWYIIYRDEGEETNYDAIGPYDSKEQAMEVMQGESGEIIRLAKDKRVVIAPVLNKDGRVVLWDAWFEGVWIGSRRTICALEVSLGLIEEDAGWR